MLGNFNQNIETRVSLMLLVKLPIAGNVKREFSQQELPRKYFVMTIKCFSAKTCYNSLYTFENPWEGLA